MRFLIEIIFCIGAAYGIGWFFSSYYGRQTQAPGGVGGLKRGREQPRGLALVQRVHAPESAVPVRPMRDKSWLS